MEERTQGHIALRGIPDRGTREISIIWVNVRSKWWPSRIDQIVVK